MCFENVKLSDIKTPKCLIELEDNIFKPLQNKSSAFSRCPICRCWFCKRSEANTKYLPTVLYW